MIPNKSTKEIFRDCLKCIPSMVKDQHKIFAVRSVLRKEFEKNKEETDAQKIEALRNNAIRGISNYMIYLIKSEYLKNPNKKEYQSIFEDPDEKSNTQTIKPINQKENE
ncbi:hypothetical protein ABPG72_016354 [Tetrahymena utriculariae]